MPSQPPVIASAVPKILYPFSGSGLPQTTLLFTYRPRKVPWKTYAAVRHDNIASAGSKEAVYERRDEFLNFEMEYVKLGSDIQNWDAFIQNAETGAPFDYFPDSTDSHTPWNGITWSPDISRFLAVGNTTALNLAAMTSPDGVLFTAQTTPPFNPNWKAVAWAPSLGIFAAVGTNAVMTSPDGINWTVQTTQTGPWVAIAWATTLSLFVAVGNGVVMTSPDGVTWTSRTPSAASNWSAVVYSPEKALFVAVANASAGTQAMTSPDGVTWTSRTIPAVQYTGIAWSPQLLLFAAVAQTGANIQISTSPDGITWTSRTTPGATATYSSIAWAPSLSLFAAVSSSNSNSAKQVITSPDGITWTLRTTPTVTSSGATGAWSGIAWSPSLSLFCAVANQSSGPNQMTSPDGLNWSFVPSFTTYTLEQTTWDAAWKQLGMYTFKMSFRKRVTAATLVPATSLPPAPAVTSFSDPLNVADPIDASSAMGSNWIAALKNPANTNALQWAIPATSPGSKLSLINVNQGGSVTAMRLTCIPIPVLVGLYGQKQFAQITVVTLAGGASDATGLGVLDYHSDCTTTGYFWAIRGDGSWSMYRANAETFTLLGSGVAGAVVNGNIIRISGDPTVAGQTTIVLTIAGVIVATIVDNAGSFLQVGTPCIHCLVTQGAGNTNYSNFSCGLGS